MRFVVVILYSTLSLAASAQVDDSFRAAYESFKQQVHKEYEDFRSKANAEYAEWIEVAWKEYQTEPVVPKPKHDEIPPVVIDDKDKDKPIEDKPIIIEEEIKIPEPLPQPEPISPIEPMPVPVISPIDEPITVPVTNTLKFTLYGTAMEVRADGKLRFSLPNVKEENIAKAWKRLSSDDYNNLIIDCLNIRKQRQLCDWAYLRMLNSMCSELLGKDTDEAELLKAYIYCQSGYKMRLAIHCGKLMMLYASQYRFYEKSCWDIDGTLFYSDVPNASQISVCMAAFPNEQPLSMAVRTEQVLDIKPSTVRTLQSDDIKWMTADVVEDENVMKFCEDYPSSFYGDDFMTHWALYANTPMNSRTKEHLYQQLRAMIKDKSTVEAVDVLCHWVQTAFVYECDDKVWGYERSFFPDETLYYPYCDCEDRSILLTRIVRDLLDLDCALVYYPKHLATAIALGEDAKGDYFRINGKKFLVCDPTYIGAPIGMTMPNMDNKTAKVIVLW